MSFGACRYLQFVKDLQEASRDNLAFIKEKAVKAIYDLLRSNPEQEALLLTALVDKLGDPSRKIASNVCPSSLCLPDVFACSLFLFLSSSWQSKIEAALLMQDLSVSLHLASHEQFVSLLKMSVLSVRTQSGLEVVEKHADWKPN